MLYLSNGVIRKKLKKKKNGEVPYIGEKGLSLSFPNCPTDVLFWEQTWSPQKIPCYYPTLKRHMAVQSLLSTLTLCIANRSGVEDQGSSCAQPDICGYTPNAGLTRERHKTACIRKPVCLCKVL